MREYRDKWVAHSDSERAGFYPALEVAKKAVWFYYGHVVKHEAASEDLTEFTPGLDLGYKHCEREAEAVYQAAATFPRAIHP